MKPSVLTGASALAVLLVGGLAQAAPQIAINELDSDTDGVDTAEFVELTDGGAGNTALDGRVLVFYNGRTGESYAAHDLDGAVTSTAGYYVLGNAGVTGVAATFGSNGLQNGQDAVALYAGDASDFPRGTPVTTAGLIDAVVYGTGDTDADVLAPLLIAGSQLDEDATGNKDNQSLQRVPDSGGHLRDTRAFALGAPTPGAANMAVGDGSSPDDTPPSDGQTLTGLRIHDVQGAAQASPVRDRNVARVPGIVTVVGTNSITIQDPDADNDPATSEAVKVFTGDAPRAVDGSTLAVGDAVSVSGRVTEYFAGNDRQSLPVTEITATGGQGIARLPAASSVLSSRTVTPVVIGANGRRPPTEIIEDDASGNVIDNDSYVFDPSEDGLDFYETLESMQVRVADAQVVSPANRFGELYVVADNGAHATGINARGGITIVDQTSRIDYNPERIQIETAGLTDTASAVNVGAHFDTITGTLGYAFGQFEIRPVDLAAPAPSGLDPETADALIGDDVLSLASYNVENLDPNDDDGDADIANGKFAAIARQIAGRLKGPDIVALQEVQDNTGSARGDGVTSADATLSRLADAIVAAGGPRYAFTEIAPVAGSNGGQPGGNIRVAYLYNPARVALADVGAKGDATTAVDVAANEAGALTLSANPGRIQPLDSAFANSRKPLAALFVFNGQRVLVIDNHFTSKGGSTSLFGAIQPPINGGADKRTRQAALVNAFIDKAQAAVPDARIAVVGDFNEFNFNPPLLTLTGADTGTPVVSDLLNTLTPAARYTYVFQGNSQALDHAFVTPALKQALRQIDVVHVNAEFAEQVSDHDPIRLQFALPDAQARVNCYLPNGRLFPGQGRATCPPGLAKR